MKLQRKYENIYLLSAAIFFVVIFVYVGRNIIVDAKTEDTSSQIDISKERFHGFYPAYASFNDSSKEYMDDLDSISFSFARIEAAYEGYINMKRGSNGNYDFYYPSNYKDAINYAKESGKSVQLSVYMDHSNAIEILPYKEKRSDIIERLVSLIEANGESSGSTHSETSSDDITYDGIVIDFEELRDRDTQGNEVYYQKKLMSQHFNHFLEELEQRLSSNKHIYVAVNTEDYYDGYDYNRIVELSDRMIVMAHDYEPVQQLKKSEITQYTSHDVRQPLDSLAPIQKVTKTLNHISQSLTDKNNMRKVWLQLSFDSAQWQYDLSDVTSFHYLANNILSKSRRVSPLYSSIKARVDNKDGKGEDISYGYNTMLQSPYITYTNTSDNTYNFILYEDSNSLSKKIELAKAHGLGGISIWGLNNVANYTDKNGMKYHLDGWSQIVSDMESYHEVIASSKNIVSVKNQYVEEAIRNYLGKEDGKLTEYDMKSIYRLHLPSTVTSIYDLKYLSNLEYISLSNSKVSNIKYLAYNKKLKVAYLNHNRISDLTGLSKLTRIEKLILNNNQINNIKPLANLSQVTFLNLGNNKITSVVSLKKMTKLKTLYLQRNSIKNIGTLSYLKKLEFLSLNGNKVRSVQYLSKLTKLKYLYLTDNQIKDVTPLKSLSKLKKLYLSGNKITSYRTLKTIASKKGFVGDFKI